MAEIPPANEIQNEMMEQKVTGPGSLQISLKNAIQVLLIESENPGYLGHLPG